MGRSPCCDKVGLKKGPWTPEEDQKLLAYIDEHGHGNWRALPIKAGLQRCGKSCRLRWTNYLRPDIKRGKFSLQEEQTIIQLHALLGNRWSAIATHLPKRTDNEIKNYWNTHLKKRLAKMGIDPVTHKPKNDTLHPTSSSNGGGVGNDISSGGGGGSQSKSAANLSHMAQWESARLEAEARLARQSKQLRPNHNTSSSLFLQSQFHHFGSSSTLTVPTTVMMDFQHYPSSTNSCSSSLNRNVTAITTGHSTPSVSSPTIVAAAVNGASSSSCLDVVGGCQYGAISSSTVSGGGRITHHSPTSTLSFSENNGTINGGLLRIEGGVGGETSQAAVIEFMGNTTNNSRISEKGKEDESTVEREWNITGDGFRDNNNSGDDDDDDQTEYNDGMENSMSFTSTLHHQNYLSIDNNHGRDEENHDEHHSVGNFMDGFTELLLSNFPERNMNPLVDEDDGGNGGGGASSGSGNDQLYDEDNKSYWNSILNLVNSSPSTSPLF